MYPHSISMHVQLPFVLLGNKCDLNAIREVDTVRAQTWARSHGIRPYEVTVINRDSLKDPFCYLTWRMANPGEIERQKCVLVCIVLLFTCKTRSDISRFLKMFL